MNARRLIPLGLVMVLAGAAAHGETAVDCAAIEDAAQRLACFDRIFGGDGTAVDRAPEEPAAPEQPAARTEPSAPAVEPPAPVAKDPEPTPPRGGGVFGLDEVVDLSTTVTAVHYREQQKMVFGLANGQIWMQVSPRYVRIREGDAVTIRNATMGGYLMRSANEVSTRVTRVH